MVAQSAPSARGEQRITLRNISWETYELILVDQADNRSPRFVYDQGELEVMSPFPVHERTSWVIARLVEAVAEVQDIDITSLGSTTFKRADLARGFEADSCFYLGHAPTIRRDEYIDLHRDPPPDLVVEIDISRSSFNKLDLFAAFGVHEFWRYTGDRLEIHVLAGASYVECDSSLLLPGVRLDEVSALVEEAKAESQRVWRRRVQAWAEALPR